MSGIHGLYGVWSTHTTPGATRRLSPSCTDRHDLNNPDAVVP